MLRVAAQHTVQITHIVAIHGQQQIVVVIIGDSQLSGALAVTGQAVGSQLCLGRRVHRGDPFAPCAISGFGQRVRAFVKIEDGCDRFCSYCIIPKSRGRVRSKAPRDRIYGDCEWLGHRFLLVDTGGIEPRADDVILSQMRAQANIAIATADVIVLVTDLRSGVVATDQDVANMLQKSGKPRHTPPKANREK